MKGKSKGNLMNFFGEASKNSKLRKKITDKLSKKDVTAGKLLNLFHGLGYDGVSLEDCGKLVGIAKRGPLPPLDPDIRKY